MFLPGPEGRQDVLQKARYTVHAGCAEQNLTITFLMPTVKNSYPPNSN